MKTGVERMRVSRKRQTRLAGKRVSDGNRLLIKAQSTPISSFVLELWQGAVLTESIAWGIRAHIQPQ